MGLPPAAITPPRETYLLDLQTCLPLGSSSEVQLPLPGPCICRPKSSRSSSAHILVGSQARTPQPGRSSSGTLAACLSRAEPLSLPFPPWLFLRKQAESLGRVEGCGEHTKAHGPRLFLACRESMTFLALAGLGHKRVHLTYTPKKKNLGPMLADLPCPQPPPPNLIQIWQGLVASPSSANHTQKVLELNTFYPQCLSPGSLRDGQHSLYKNFNGLPAFSTCSLVWHTEGFRFHLGLCCQIGLGKTPA